MVGGDYCAQPLTHSSHTGTRARDCRLSAPRAPPVGSSYPSMHGCLKSSCRSEPISFSGHIALQREGLRQRPPVERSGAPQRSRLIEFAQMDPTRQKAKELSQAMALERGVRKTVRDRSDRGAQI